MGATIYDEVKVYDVRSIDFVAIGTESLGNMLQISNVSRSVLRADTFLEVHWSISLEKSRRDDHCKRTLHDVQEKLAVIVTETQEIQSIVDTDDDCKLECDRETAHVSVFPDEDRYFAFTRYSFASGSARSTGTVKSNTVLWSKVYDEDSGTWWWDHNVVRFNVWFQVKGTDWERKFKYHWFDAITEAISGTSLVSPAHSRTHVVSMNYASRCITNRAENHPDQQHDRIPTMLRKGEFRRSCDRESSSEFSERGALL